MNASQDPSTAAAAISNWNLPNALTTIRIVLIPIFAWLCLRGAGTDSKWMWAATITFCLLMLTDKLDGDIARARGIVTNFGKIADPIADKALMGTAFICLNILGLLPVWVTVAIMFREFGITFWRMAQLRRGVVVPASKGGKLKTTVQSAAVILLLVPLGAHTHLIGLAIAYFAVAVTLLTGAQYLIDSRRLANAS